MFGHATHTLPRDGGGAVLKTHMHNTPQRGCKTWIESRDESVSQVDAHGARCSWPGRVMALMTVVIHSTDRAVAKSQNRPCEGLLESLCQKCGSPQMHPRNHGGAPLTLTTL